MGGFECSTHRLRSGERLDIVEATRHNEFAAQDYARCAELGIRTVREGIRWHRIEKSPGRFDFSCELPRIRAARDSGIQVIWDLFHYGWPDDLNIFSAQWVDRFARMTRAFAELLANETDETQFFCPVNEISFVAWGGGDVEYLNPFERGRGPELKRQLVRATLAACEAVWDVDRRTRICHIDPIIHIVADPLRPHQRLDAERYRQSMFQAWDMIAGYRDPELGGDPRYLDIIGINYYDKNQWVHRGPVLTFKDPLFRPLRDIILEVHRRYKRPLFVAETGTEFDARPEWIRYVTDEVRAVMEGGCPIQGICYYPILNHPGWDDSRHLQCGLWDYADDFGNRDLCEPLHAEFMRLREKQFRVGHPPVRTQERREHSRRVVRV